MKIINSYPPHCPRSGIFSMRPSEDNFAASQIRRERWLVELIPVWRSFAGECSSGKGPDARAVIGWAASVDTSHDIRDRSIRSVSSPTETEPPTVIFSRAARTSGPNATGRCRCRCGTRTVPLSAIIIVNNRQRERREDGCW